MKAERWLCRGCGRQWVDAYKWESSMGCPLCASPAIESVTFESAIPGIVDVPPATAVQPVDGQAMIARILRHPSSIPAGPPRVSPTLTVIPAFTALNESGCL